MSGALRVGWEGRVLRGWGGEKEKLVTADPGIQTAGVGVGGGGWWQMVGEGQRICTVQARCSDDFLGGKESGKDRARPLGWLRLPMLRGKTVSGPCPKFSV